MNITAASVGKFQREVLGHYKRHGRKMPWRETDDPYCILVSEIMLQQTQVSRVAGKYEQFVKAFPNFKALDDAPLAKVYAVWQGLGYNRRALALKKIARIVVSQPCGVLPQTHDELVRLPGIGAATASSIAAFAFNKPVVFVETNIRTVFIHFFFKKKKKVADAEILPLVDQCLYRGNPRVWYWALMDYGVLLKKSGEDKNERSAQYVKQTKFEGSTRQVRGKVLKLLAARGSIDERELVREINDKRVPEIVDDLVAEGFLQRRRGRVRIRNV
jgi:A/G-specific adenine glycosylase